MRSRSARRAAKASPAFAPGVVQAAELALQANRRRLAVQLLEDCWRAEPHPDVARAYAQVDPSETASQRQKRIDSRLAPLNRNHAETLVLQAEVAMQAGDWSSARSRLEAALDAGPTARVYRLLAELERQSHGDGVKAQEWLARATDATPDRAWVCDDTGEVLPSWRRWRRAAGSTRSTGRRRPRSRPCSAPSRPSTSCRATMRRRRARPQRAQRPNERLR